MPQVTGIFFINMVWCFLLSQFFGQLISGQVLVKKEKASNVLAFLVYSGAGLMFLNQFSVLRLFLGAAETVDVKVFVQVFIIAFEGV